jgi:hypothetical protein
MWCKKTILRLVINTTMVLLAVCNTDCRKEYSYEGGSAPSVRDTVPPPPPPPPIVYELPFCASCAVYTNPIQLNKWSLKAGNAFACGTLDTAIINLERTSFTFFGPSTCSRDTGLVMTVYVENEKLNRDISNLVINRVAFYYYDRVTPSHIYMNMPNVAFSVVVDSYNHQTKILTGSFRGSALRRNGSAASISEGRFKVKLL